jgi:hypothetical protein
MRPQITGTPDVCKRYVATSRLGYERKIASNGATPEWCHPLLRIEALNVSSSFVSFCALNLRNNNFVPKVLILLNTSLPIKRTALVRHTACFPSVFCSCSVFLRYFCCFLARVFVSSLFNTDCWMHTGPSRVDSKRMRTWRSPVTIFTSAVEATD